MRTLAVFGIILLSAQTCFGQLTPAQHQLWRQQQIQLQKNRVNHVAGGMDSVRETVQRQKAEAAAKKKFEEDVRKAIELLETAEREGKPDPSISVEEKPKEKKQKSKAQILAEKQAAEYDTLVWAAAKEIVAEKKTAAKANARKR